MGPSRYFHGTMDLSRSFHSITLCACSCFFLAYHYNIMYLCFVRCSRSTTQKCCVIKHNCLNILLRMNNTLCAVVKICLICALYKCLYLLTYLLTNLLTSLYANQWQWRTISISAEYFPSNRFKFILTGFSRAMFFPTHHVRVLFFTLQFRFHRRTLQAQWDQKSFRAIRSKTTDYV